jgi:hypothetical protein
MTTVACGTCRHHALAAALGADGADAALDLGVAFHLLVFVARLLDRHLLPLPPAVALVDEVGNRR